MTLPVFETPKYRPDVDGLRAVAILTVMGYHAFPSLVWGGFAGVDIFFVISGFFITTMLLENMDQGHFSLTDFYGRRIRRIFPALILVMLASLAFGAYTLTPPEYKHLGQNILAGAGFYANIILWKDVDPDIIDPMLHLWSLAIEEQFYIVWPLLLWGIYKLRWNVLWATLALTLASFAHNMAMVERDGAYTFSLPQTRVWELLLGAIVAYFSLYKPIPAGHFPEWATRHIHHIASIGGACILVTGFMVTTNEVHFPGAWGLFPTIGTALLIIAGPNACVNQLLLSNRPMIWFGLISYPLYIWHWQFLYFLKVIYGGIAPPEYRFTALLVSVLLAWLTFRFIEIPIRFGPYKTQKTILLVCCIACCAAIGYVIS